MLTSIFKTYLPMGDTYFTLSYHSINGSWLTQTENFSIQYNYAVLHVASSCKMLRNLTIIHIFWFLRNECDKVGFLWSMCLSGGSNINVLICSFAWAYWQHQSDTHTCCVYVRALAFKQSCLIFFCHHTFFYFKKGKCTISSNSSGSHIKRIFKSYLVWASFHRFAVMQTVSFKISDTQSPIILVF